MNIDVLYSEYYLNYRILLSVEKYDYSSMMSSMTDNDLTNSLKALGLEHSRSRV